MNAQHDASGRVPPCDLDAERAVLATVLLDLGRVPAVRAELGEGDWFAPEHAAIWRALTALADEGAAVDAVTVAARLRETGKLSHVGGSPYLAELLDATPAVANVAAHAAIVRDRAELRRIIDACHETAASGYTATDAGALRAELLRRVQSGPQDRERLSSILAAWRPLAVATFTDPPPPRDWLLRHPDRDGQECPPAEGDGLLPRGKVGVLAAAGGGSKTDVLVALAVSVVTGKPWLGHFHVDWRARAGRVLLGLAEEDEAEVRRRLHRVAASYKLTGEEHERCAECIVALPLAGKPVGLVRLEGRAVVEARTLNELRAQLAAEAGGAGWALIVLDPLARWAGLDAESSNEVATRFVEAVETLAEAPGNPTVLLAHHSSKLARRSGSVDARGVTGITDALRWEGTLRADGRSVYFQQAKSNYSRPMPNELRLVRDEHRVLRVATAAEEREREALAELARQDALDADVATLAAYLRSLGGSFSGGADTLAVAAGMARNRARAALAHGKTRGWFSETGKSRDRRLAVGEAAP